MSEEIKKEETNNVVNLQEKKEEKEKKDGFGLTLTEMYVIYLLSKKVKLIAHRIGLKKQIDDFVENEKFARLMNLKEMIEENANEIREKYSKESAEMRKKVVPYDGKPVSEMPEDLRKEYIEFNNKLVEKEFEKNNSLSQEFDELNKSKDKYYKKISNLTKNAITEFLKDEKTKIEDIGLTEVAIELLVNLYCRLEEYKPKK